MGIYGYLLETLVRRVFNYYIINTIIFIIIIKSRYPHIQRCTKALGRKNKLPDKVCYYKLHWVNIFYVKLAISSFHHEHYRYNIFKRYGDDCKQNGFWILNTKSLLGE